MLMAISPWMAGFMGAAGGFLAGAITTLAQHYRELDPIRELTERLRHPVRWSVAHPVRAARSYVEKRRVLR